MLNEVFELTEIVDRICKTVENETTIFKRVELELSKDTLMYQTTTDDGEDKLFKLVIDKINKSFNFTNMKTQEYLEFNDVNKFELKMLNSLVNLAVDVMRGVVNNDRD